MTSTEPRVYVLAETVLNYRETVEWLLSLGAERYLSKFENEYAGEINGQGYSAEKVIELAARRCYMSFEPGLNPNVTKVREDEKEYFDNIKNAAHGSVMEHSSATFALEGVSRVVTHELVRHRAGAAYSQESLRYVRLTDIKFWTPPEIQKTPEANTLFQEVVGHLELVQNQLAQIFKIDTITNFNVKKRLTSAFRRLAPIGLATGIVCTFNFRTLRWLIELRTSQGAEVEIRLVMNRVADIAMRRWPLIFGDFRKGMFVDQKFEEGQADEYGLYEYVPSNRKI